MSTVPEASKPRRRGSLLVVLVSLVAIAASAGAIVMQMNPKRDVNADLVKIRELGHATSAEEVEKAAKTGTPNAAPVLRQAVEEWKKKPARERDALLNIGRDLQARPVLAADTRTIRSHVVKFDPVISLAERASTMPVCNWERDWTEGPGIFFSETASIRQIAGMLLLRARASAAEGNIDAAVKDVQTADRIAMLAADDPALTPFMSSLNLKTMCDSAVRKIISENKLSKPQLEKFQKVIDEGAAMPDLRYGLMSELSFVRIALKDVEHLSNYVTHLVHDGKDMDFTSPKMRREAEQRVVRAWLIVWQQMPKDTSNYQEVWDAFQAGTNELTKDQSAPGKLSQLLWQHHGLTLDQWARSAAQRRMLQTAIRLKIHQVEKGSLPDTLPDYGEASTDPFDKKPLRYKKTEEGFTLYSVGGDGDQGGLTGFEAREKGGDIVWKIQA